MPAAMTVEPRFLVASVTYPPLSTASAVEGLASHILPSAFQKPPPEKAIPFYHVPALLAVLGNFWAACEKYQTGFDFRHPFPSAYNTRFRVRIGKTLSYRIIALGIWSTLACCFTLIRPISFLSSLPNSIALSLVMGLPVSLLVQLRLNTAYERFWEGCKAWYALQSCILNLTRQIQVFIATRGEPEGQKTRKEVISLLCGLGYALRLHIQEEQNDVEWIHLLEAKMPTIAMHKNVPMIIIKKIEAYLVNSGQSTLAMHQCISQIDSICELMEGFATPIPAGYSVHLSQILVVYHAALAFQLIPALGWLSIFATCILAFMVLGVVAISDIIENPFDDDLHDLPIDLYCQDIEVRVKEMVYGRDESGKELGWGIPHARNHDYHKHWVYR
ncbi:UNVERIFIED_CONTAM: hypothetical protein HDU68_003859 [Siphonaria sp. JEL0065]|nr:hypothetical protein HDU68_003859 [Siphonaria sp. JEL0065]